MSSESAATIRVESLTKHYRLYGRPHDRLRELLRPTSRPRGVPVRALDGVSFEVRAGETVGVIGRNAAGKSTLLQCLAGTLVPTSGVCEVRGRVGALLELRHRSQRALLLDADLSLLRHGADQSRGRSARLGIRCAGE